MWKPCIGRAPSNCIRKTCPFSTVSPLITYLIYGLLLLRMPAKTPATRAAGVSAGELRWPFIRQMGPAEASVVPK